MDRYTKYIKSYEKTINLNTIKEDNDSITVEGYMPDMEPKEYIASIHMEGIDKNGNIMIFPCDIINVDREKNIVNIDFKKEDNDDKEKHKKHMLDLINIRIKQLENIEMFGEDIIKEKLEEFNEKLEKDNLILYHYGINIIQNKDFLIKITEFDNVERAIEEIPELFSQRKSFNRESSSFDLAYLLKDYRHQIDGHKDRSKDRYISEGELILAMYCLGYEYEQCTKTSMSCYFNCNILHTCPYYPSNRPTINEIYYPNK